jgi:hypothetical protein
VDAVVKFNEQSTDIYLCHQLHVSPLQTTAAQPIHPQQCATKSTSRYWPWSPCQWWLPTVKRNQAKEEEVNITQEKEREVNSNQEEVEAEKEKVVRITDDPTEILKNGWESQTVYDCHLCCEGYHTTCVSDVPREGR